MKWNADFEIAAIIVEAIFIFFFFGKKHLPTRKNTFFSFCMVVSVFVCFFDLLSAYMDSNWYKFSMVSLQAVNVMYFLTSTVLTLSFFIYIILMTESYEVFRSPIFYLYCIPFMVHVFLDISTPFTGYLYYFDPEKDSVPFDSLTELDKWACYALDALIDKAGKAYDAFDFHVIYHAVYSFCVLDMSSFYLEIIKDRLYVEKADSLSRRAAQTVIYKVLNALVKIVAPILSFTSDEAWQYIRHTSGEDGRSVFFNDFPKVEGLSAPAEFTAKWDKIIAVRNDVQKALELARAEKIIGKPLDAEVKLYVSAKEEFAKLEKLPLAELFIVSKADVIYAEGEGYEAVEFPGVKVKVEACQAPKCVRCWMHSDTVGQNAEHPELCERCAKAVSL